MHAESRRGPRHEGGSVCERTRINPSLDAAQVRERDRQRGCWMRRRAGGTRSDAEVQRTGPAGDRSERERRGEIPSRTHTCDHEPSVGSCCTLGPGYAAPTLHRASPSWTRRVCRVSCHERERGTRSSAERELYHSGQFGAEAFMGLLGPAVGHFLREIGMFIGTNETRYLIQLSDN